jgi:hypothetical protein
MNKSFIVLVTLFLSTVIFSQTKTIFIDETNREITKDEFKEKCNTYFYKCFDYASDTLKFKKVLYRYSFGQLTNDELTQIKLLLKSDQNIELKKDEFLVVKYWDTITNFQERLRRYKIHVKKHESEDNTIEHKEFNRKIHDSNIASWVKKKKKCIKNFKKRYPIEIIYMYRNDTGGIQDYKEFNWISDERNIFKNRFFKLMNNYHLLVVKPNGNYFLCGGHFSEKSLKSLLNTEDWNEILIDYNTFRTKFRKNGYGIFKKPNFYHKSQCF